MNLLYTGSGHGGSWKIRGDQFGRALGATLIPQARDVAAFDAAVVVKRPADVVHRLRGAGVPLIWDIVDAWPQPDGNNWARDECVSWLKYMVRSMRPAGIVAATKAMASDCAKLGVPVYVLPHHHRPELKRTEMRPLQVVGYEGGVRNLGQVWTEFLHRECARRGWAFVINPPSINEMDVVVALRERDGYAPMHWKSNVKLANAQGSGTPILCGPEAGCLETATGAECFVRTEADVVRALDMLEPIEARAALSERLYGGRISLQSLVMPFKSWLREVVCLPALSS